MAGIIREMSSEVVDSHVNFDLFGLDSSVRRKTRKLETLPLEEESYLFEFDTSNRNRAAMSEFLPYRNFT